jgi:long-chain acyl-CoA synthetase
VDPELCQGNGRIAARLAKQVEFALNSVDLSVSQYRLIAFLSEGPSHASTLAETLILSRPSVTALADGLVDRGLIDRAPSSDDRRRVVHVLTDKGLRVLEEADGAVEARLASLAEELPEAERKRASSGLKAWGRALDSVLVKAVKST